MSQSFRDTVTGLVLAGGLGRRMGGVDKGLEPLHGKPMAACVVERLEPQVNAVLINANRNAERYAAFGKPVVPDLLADFPGPLAGLHAGLSVCPTPLLASAPCDAPFLPADLVSRLYEGMMGAAADLAVARAGGRVQPVFALMKRDLLDSLRDFLAGGGRSVGAWHASLRVAEVDFEDAAAFANLNTREDLELVPGR